MKKSAGRPKDPDRVRLHLQLKRGLVDLMIKKADKANRPLSRQFEVEIERSLSIAEP
jgi:hypothetical protein